MSSIDKRNRTVLLISDRDSGLKPNYSAFLNNVKNYLKNKYKDVEGWRIWGMFNSKLDYKAYRDTLYDTINTTTKNNALEVWNNTSEDSKRSIVSSMN